MASIKHKLFEQYSANLTKNSTLSEGWFVCPLCHQVFDWERETLLSIEHVIPKALGGKLLTLTCKKCNNDYGSKYIHNWEKI